MDGLAHSRDTESNHEGSDEGKDSIEKSSSDIDDYIVPLRMRSITNSISLTPSHQPKIINSVGSHP